MNIDFGRRGPNTTETWLTPPEIIRDLGPFDLDPCAAPEPRPWPTATRHIALPEDGLSAEWSGVCWVNPPYGPHTGDWLDRLAEHGAGGIALTFARTETDWFFRTVWEKAGALLFVRGRLTFHRPDGSPGRFNGSAPSVLISYRDEATRRLAQSRIDGHLIVNSAAILLRSDGTAVGTWREVIREAMAGRQMRLRDLYAAVEDTSKVRAARSKNVEWKSKIRRVLQEHFQPVDFGVWAPQRA